MPRFHKTFAGTKPSDQSLPAQQRIADDLVALTQRRRCCLPISVPYATPVPLLALYLHTSPANIDVAPMPRGTYLATGEPRRLHRVPARPARHARGSAASRRGFRLTRAQPLVGRVFELSVVGFAACGEPGIGACTDPK